MWRRLTATLLTRYTVGKIGHYLPWALAGTAVHTVACGLLSRFSTDTPTPYWILSQLLAGCGRGMSLQVVSCNVTNSSSREQRS